MTILEKKNRVCNAWSIQQYKRTQHNPAHNHELNWRKTLYIISQNQKPHLSYYPGKPQKNELVLMTLHSLYKSHIKYKIYQKAKDIAYIT